MIKDLIEPPFSTMEESIPPNNGPDVPAIARVTGYRKGKLPQQYIEQIAHCQALFVEVKEEIYLEGHLDFWASGVPEVRTTPSFGILCDAYSQEVFHREYVSGVIVLADTSFGGEEERFWQLSLLFFPKKVLEDPRILDDLCTGGEDCTLDRVLQAELWQFLERYTGPGDVLIDDRDGFLPAPIRLEITGEENEILDSEDVAEGLFELFRDGEFERCYAETIERIAAIHTRVRRVLKARDASRKG